MQPPQIDEVVELLERAIRRCTDLLRAAGDGSKVIPKLGWTIGETAAHLRLLMPVYTGLAAGGSHYVADVVETALANAEKISLVAERDPAVLAAMIDDEAPALVHAYRTYGGGPIGYVARIRPPAPSVAAIFAAEFLIHCYDIATALGVPWRIPAADAVVITRGCARCSRCSSLPQPPTSGVSMRCTSAAAPR